jgi:hypothetical protein
LVEPVPWSFVTQVEATLDSPALKDLLAIADLKLAEHPPHKQTDTTRRWKIGIEVSGRAELVRSKVEFTGREGEGDYVLARLPEALVEPYALRPPSVQHYDAPSAIVQKVAALVGRTQTEARDVFDLELLLRRTPLERGTLDPDLLEAAVERIFEQSYDAFRDKVLAFLEPGAAELIESPAAWEEIQTYVAGKLEAAR